MVAAQRRPRHHWKVPDPPAPSSGVEDPTGGLETGDHVGMRLPARSAADVHLAESFEGPGCPLCAEVARADDQWLESILSESVNDVPFRQALDAARGLCRRHAREVLEADRRRSGSLGAAILLRATLVARLRELEATHAARGWTRARRATEAARTPACPGCAREATTDAWLASAVVRLAADAAWSDAIGAAPVCLPHLVALMRERGASPGWEAAEARQLERLRDLRDLLEGFAHASSHDRRHLQTDAQRAAVDAAADLLAADTGRGRQAGA